MKIKQLREMQTDHLEHELLDQQKHLFELRTQAVTEKLENPAQIGSTRRQIARVKTLLWQRKLETKKTAAAGKISAEGEASAQEPKTK
jgi:large subunit ribosomal protein L29